MMRKLIALAALLLSSCGYSLVGRGNMLDPSIHTIEVPAFVNKTTRVELEQRVTQSVADEFVSRGRLRLVKTPAEADAMPRETSRNKAMENSLQNPFMNFLRESWC